MDQKYDSSKRRGVGQGNAADGVTPVSVKTEFPPNITPVQVLVRNLQPEDRVYYSDSGENLIVSGKDRIILFQARTGNELYRTEGYRLGDELWRLSNLMAASTHVIVEEACENSPQGTCKKYLVYNLVNGRKIPLSDFNSVKAKGIVVQEEYNSVVTADTDGKVQMYSLDTGERVRTFYLRHPDDSLSYSNNGFFAFQEIDVGPIGRSDGLRKLSIYPLADQNFNAIPLPTFYQTQALRPVVLNNGRLLMYRSMIGISDPTKIPYGVDLSAGKIFDLVPQWQIIDSTPVSSASDSIFLNYRSDSNGQRIGRYSLKEMKIVDSREPLGWGIASIGMNESYAMTTDSHGKVAIYDRQNLANGFKGFEIPENGYGLIKLAPNARSLFWHNEKELRLWAW